MRLLKGLEEEVYSGTNDYVAKPLSHRAAADLQGFSKEPDARNIEFTSQPLPCYEQLGCEILARRTQLRSYLNKLGGYTLLPGSCLPQDDGVFMRSDPANRYHTLIEDTYGTAVVTAGTHINIGINDPELNLRAWRTVRMESALYLALSAASPFHNGVDTGFHSFRWHRFPLTPADLPMFSSHSQFVSWVDDRLKDQQMYNVRHLWASVRPNGNGTPHQLDRLELRICDRIDSILELLAITALFEARIWTVLEDPQLDPLKQATWLPAATRERELVGLERHNNLAAARNSLDARYRRWQDGREVWLRDELNDLLERLTSTITEHCLTEVITPLHEIIRHGNPAQKWLCELRNGRTVQQIMTDAIPQMEAREKLYACGCQD